MHFSFNSSSPFSGPFTALVNCHLLNQVQLFELEWVLHWIQYLMYCYHLLGWFLWSTPLVFCQGLNATSSVRPTAAHCDNRWQCWYPSVCWETSHPDTCQTSKTFKISDICQGSCAFQFYSTRHNFLYSLMLIPSIPLLADPYAYFACLFWC